MLLQSENTVLTVSNAIALTTAIVKQVSGNEIADTINGKVIETNVLSDMIASQMNKTLSNKGASA